MPYRVDISAPPPNALDLLLNLGALDVDSVAAGIAAILPDSVPAASVATAFAPAPVQISSALGRDNGSVWLLHRRTVQVGDIYIAPASAPPAPRTVRLIESNAFGTGHHPTTLLCLELLQPLVRAGNVTRVLDVGTGSGVLALAALLVGAAEAVGVDTDPAALAAAAANARLNGLAERLHLLPGGPEAVGGQWRLVLANVLAASLIDMASVLVRRLAGSGRLVLSGVSSGLENEVAGAYRRAGLRHLQTHTRDGWTALEFAASW